MRIRILMIAVIGLVGCGGGGGGLDTKKVIVQPDEKEKKNALLTKEKEEKETKTSSEDKAKSLTDQEITDAVRKAVLVDASDKNQAIVLEMLRGPQADAVAAEIQRVIDAGKDEAVTNSVMDMLVRQKSRTSAMDRLLLAMANKRFDALAQEDALNEVQSRVYAIVDAIGALGGKSASTSLVNELFEILKKSSKRKFPHVCSDIGRAYAAMPVNDEVQKAISGTISEVGKLHFSNPDAEYRACLRGALRAASKKYLNDVVRALWHMDYLIRNKPLVAPYAEARMLLLDLPLKERSWKNPKASVGEELPPYSLDLDDAMRAFVAWKETAKDAFAIGQVHPRLYDPRKEIRDRVVGYLLFRGHGLYDLRSAVEEEAKKTGLNDEMNAILNQVIADLKLPIELKIPEGEFSKEISEFVGGINAFLREPGKEGILLKTIDQSKTLFLKNNKVVSEFVCEILKKDDFRLTEVKHVILMGVLNYLAAAPTASSGLIYDVLGIASLYVSFTPTDRDGVPQGIWLTLLTHRKDGISNEQLSSVLSAAVDAMTWHAAEPPVPAPGLIRILAVHDFLKKWTDDHEGQLKTLDDKTKEAIHSKLKGVENSLTGRGDEYEQQVRGKISVLAHRFEKQEEK